MKKALVFWCGWSGHDPDKESARFAEILRKNYYEVDVVNGLDILKDKDYLAQIDLFVPCCTMSDIPGDCCRNICDAVSNGAGIAGCHGGMCDAFRNSTDWQFMTGGQWVSHPGGDGIEYEVKIKRDDFLFDGIPDFMMKSEHYYMHVDPAVDVHATTMFYIDEPFTGMRRAVEMPVSWTKYFGKGRVFYSSLGHQDAEFDKFPEMLEMMTRGLLWAGKGREISKKIKQEN